MSLSIPLAADGGGVPGAGLDLPLWFEVGSFAVLVVILAIDLILAVRRPHVPSIREASLWIGFYVALALVFAGLMLWVSDIEHAGQFVAGWLTEYSLSIDNLFVFIIIMSRFKVPKRFQQEALMIGIVLALVFRGIFILIGAAVIERFSWIFYLFGAFLVFTAVRQAIGEDDADGGENRLMRWLRRTLNIGDTYDGIRFTVIEDGRRRVTPMVLVLVSLATTDLLFALDSIPAIFGITQSAFIVFTANVFALMGLRQLYFLLGGLLERLKYLHYGIAAILAFIGVKLVLHALHENSLPFINGGRPLEAVPEIDTWTSLAVIIVSMAVAVVASLIASRRDAVVEHADLAVRETGSRPAVDPDAVAGGRAPTADGESSPSSPQSPSE